MAVTLDPQFGGKPADHSALEALFRRYDVPYEVRRTLIGPIVFDYRNEKNPCSLCAKMRRGALHAAAEELDCHKVALGHHLDDAIETFYMNLWREGRIGCFSPVTELSDRGLTLIRPLLLATEQEVRCAVKEEGFPIVKSRCPADGVTTREDTKKLCPGAVPHRPCFPAEDPSRSAGERHRRLASFAPGPYIKKGGHRPCRCPHLKNTSGPR